MEIKEGNNHVLIFIVNKYDDPQGLAYMVGNMKSC